MTPPGEVLRPAPDEVSGPSRRTLALVVLVLLCIPLAVVAVALRSPRWYPVLDLTMTELRVRDVGTADTPLIGLPGRIGSIEQQGSHPGSVSFYALAPAYRALGSSAWALQVATVVLHAAAMGTTLALAARRGGTRLVAGVGAALAVLALGYGFQVLTEPWNPYMPLLWWIAFLLAAWGLLERDWWSLPVAAAAGSLCAQTHLPYLGLCGALGVGALGWAVWGERRRERRWPPRAPVGLALGIVGLLWAPVVVDQLTNDPGNLTLLWRHMTEPSGDPVGMRTGLHVMLVHLDLRHLLGGRWGLAGGLVDTTYDPLGPVLPGVALLGAWALAAVASVRRGPARLRHLHAVLGAALLLGLYSAGSIFGKLWFYLTLWGWGLGVLMAVAALWTLVAVLGERSPSPRGWRDPLVAAPLAVVVAASGVLSVEAIDAPPPAEPLSRGLGLVLEPAIEAIEAGEGAATGRDGRYVVSWTDAMHFGSQGYAIVSELEREGFQAGFFPFSSVPGTAHRVLGPGEPTAVVHLASGIFIDEYADTPGAIEVARADPRSRAEREEYEQLRARLLAGLEEEGLGDLVPWVDRNVFGVAIDTRLPLELRRAAERMLDLGLPLAIFVSPA